MRVIKYSIEAHDDIVRLNEYIAQVCKAPLTAKRYLMGLEQRIMWLQQMLTYSQLCLSYLLNWAILSGA